ncbi:unnamed protein product [marine sediment metagenome]|uniref:Uncharacterized protein n=1 Tax=marine sediment metagenome TaxID=412755 RepID=X0RQ76_9ZZZZ
MRLIKCFETSDMPNDVATLANDILEGQDSAVFWVECEMPSEENVVAWFIKNGAKRGEKVLIERGTW